MAAIFFLKGAVKSARAVSNRTNASIPRRHRRARLPDPPACLLPRIASSFRSEPRQGLLAAPPKAYRKRCAMAHTMAAAEAAWRDSLASVSLADLATRSTPTPAAPPCRASAACCHPRRAGSGAGRCRSGASDCVTSSGLQRYASFHALCCTPRSAMMYTDERAATVADAACVRRVAERILPV